MVEEEAGLPQCDVMAPSLRNVGNHKPHNMALHPRIPEPSLTYFSANADILSGPAFQVRTEIPLRTCGSTVSPSKYWTERIMFSGLDIGRISVMYIPVFSLTQFYRYCQHDGCNNFWLSTDTINYCPLVVLRQKFTMTLNFFKVVFYKTWYK
jgi:hypothetical protein